MSWGSGPDVSGPGVTYHARPATLGPPLGLYTHVATAPLGTLVAVAGQTGIEPTGALAGDGSVAAQTAQCFVNLGAALASVGASYRDIIKSTTFLVGRGTVSEFMTARREVFAELFPDGAYPPNSLMVVEGLVEERYLVEIEAFAVLSPVQVP